MSSEEDMNRSARRAAMPSKSYLFSKSFLAGSLERMVRTFAQTFLAVFGVSGASSAVSLNLFADGAGAVWISALGVSTTAAILSLLMSVVAGASGVGPTGSPSLVDDRPSNAELADSGRHHADDGIDVALDNPKEFR
jgi:hypothetical protein